MLSLKLTRNTYLGIAIFAFVGFVLGLVEYINQDGGRWWSWVCSFVVSMSMFVQAYRINKRMKQVC